MIWVDRGEKLSPTGHSLLFTGAIVIRDSHSTRFTLITPCSPGIHAIAGRASQSINNTCRRSAETASRFMTLLT